MNGQAACAATAQQIPQRHRPSPLEACVTVPWGQDRFASPLPAPDGRTPRAVIEAMVLRHLRRPPCLVTFSGGVDSSSVLAIAAFVARREGLELPIPITHRFPDAKAADETEWQERVIEHLGLHDWVRLSWTDELDLLGPYGLRVLQRHGPMFPPNAHFVEPMLERAAGGSLLTGLGGDELLGPGPRALSARLLYRRIRPSARQLPALMLECAPQRLRAQVLARQVFVNSCPWLRPDVRRHVTREYARAVTAAAVLRWDESVERLWRSRYLQAYVSALAAMSAAHGVALGSPFSDPEVMSAFAEEAGPVGPSSRVSALTRLVGDLLPQPVLRRTTKALFDEAFWNRHSRAFVERWSGRGVDERLVDIDVLRSVWRSASPPAHSCALLQYAWLAEPFTQVRTEERTAGGLPPRPAVRTAADESSATQAAPAGP